jgi:hypothetical protein
MSRRRKAFYLFLGLAVVLALLAAKMIVQVRRGEELFWLAELWAPAAVFSLGLVTGIEFLMPPAPSMPKEKSPKKQPLPRFKPKKA